MLQCLPLATLRRNRREVHTLFYKHFILELFFPSKSGNRSPKTVVITKYGVKHESLILKFILVKAKFIQSLPHSHTNMPKENQQENYCPREVFHLFIKNSIYTETVSVIYTHGWVAFLKEYVLEFQEMQLYFTCTGEFLQ